MPDPRQGIPIDSSSGARTVASREVPSGTFGSVTCPFCGLHCDDLEVSSQDRRLSVLRNGCDLAKAGFERAIPETSPMVDGRPASLEAALKRAGELIAAARLPLYGGLGTDVEGMRGVMALADRSGGVVDHAASAAQYRNVGVLQTRGWVMSTLTETRNRADLVVIVASDVATLHPRFIERILAPADTMLEAAPRSRTVVLLGKGTAASRFTGGPIGDVIDIPCDAASIPGVLATLRAILRDVPLGDGAAASVPVDALSDLAQRCRKASYAVFVWAPQAFDFPEADAAVHAIAEIVRDLNKSTRAAGLTLGGNDGGASAASVCSWQSGYPLRVSFAGGIPTYDPYRFDIARMLAAGEGDLLVWVSTFGPPPPATAKVPVIALAAPDAKFSTPPAVFIPVATPGLDIAGRLVRCDSVVSLPLRRLRALELPSLSEIASRLLATLPAPAATAAE